MNQDLHYCILGLGISGISCLEFLIEQKIKKITAIDLKKTPELIELADKYKQINFILGDFTIPIDADYLILSPGINPLLPEIEQAKQRGAKLTNDINIFLEQINLLKQSKPIKIAAVTGTNGKTTVVNILASMAKQHNIKYALCGNVGYPVLNYLSQDIELYILELSSFQLELINQLAVQNIQNIFDVACILNITPDHLDRYSNFFEYCAAKLNIYKQAKYIVYNKEDLNTHYTNCNNLENSSYFSINHPDIALLKEINLLGEHNILNALACLAIGNYLNFSKDIMINAIKNFVGLEYRCQKIGTFEGITWINDSKGTNIGATIAAINSINKINTKNLIIILGGVNKNSDLSILGPYIANTCKAAILIGECKDQLFKMFNKLLNCYLALDLSMAVNIAKKIANNNDIVLLSPACASFDMFKDYKHRGAVFQQCVLELNNVSST
jgi:UDP-N-acetylmuramoylalanine--D-glutamate ligase